MKSVKGETFNVKRGLFILTTMVIALTVPMLAACAGNLEG